jgi:GalNAc-alpha-(1->4)-GalNAc-alpha-(1->3)-diNAcBac-PP-undecaprenol alpha-1,4-N-acetyl-D-galactosaminyltransferase
MLISPDLSAGGAERVIATLANNLAEMSNIEVHLVLLVQGNEFYTIDQRVNLHRPTFDYKQLLRMVAVIKTCIYVRNKIKKIEPISYLCFGGKYNSLALIAGIGLKSNSFVSDRSRPGISYGFLQDHLNKLIYPKATGLIAQTSQAKDYYWKTLKHPNIRVIGNPAPIFFDPRIKKKNVILNVGRFIPSKNQELLLEMFSSIDNNDWELWFLGEGKLENHCKKRAVELGIIDRVKFLGSKENILSFYNQCSVFAFTSLSEGFPNALAEAMSAGCACISFDCFAGPSDLIENSKNGFLVPVEDYYMYKLRLKQLMDDKQLRIKFGIEARKKSATLSEKEITKRYLDFLLEFT